MNLMLKNKINSFYYLKWLLNLSEFQILEYFNYKILNIFIKSKSTTSNAVENKKLLTIQLTLVSGFGIKYNLGNIFYNILTLIRIYPKILRIFTGILNNNLLIGKKFQSTIQKVIFKTWNLLVKIKVVNN
ncbi:hypothetical protein BpHYR1_014738 [Brachionus plicatilis]|uniref:Uncharacterized protein n=1 Tax=Brachionus plicatilis TaxID=10195 RepID=A0A3M7T6Y7_BRAPC|nr:hypothetical protein BpHYR1_014738 [Brachionus plicatilis]